MKMSSGNVWKDSKKVMKNKGLVRSKKENLRASENDCQSSYSEAVGLKKRFAIFEWNIYKHFFNSKKQDFSPGGTIL